MEFVMKLLEGLEKPKAYGGDAQRLGGGGRPLYAELLEESWTSLGPAVDVAYLELEAE